MRRFDELADVFSGWEQKETLALRQSSVSCLPLRLDERILRFLSHSAKVDSYFNGTVKLSVPQDELAPMIIREEQVNDLAAVYEYAKDGFVYMAGAKGIGKRFLVAHYSRQQGKNLLLVNGPDSSKRCRMGYGR